MNFYTLTFKTYIQLIFIIVFILFLGLNLSIGIYSNGKTSDTRFINNKYSKSEHFLLNNPVNSDFIFIGSSRTFYNISSNFFIEKGINVFNYGIAGGKLTDYPEVINNVITVKPTSVVISVSLSELTNELELPKYPTAFDMAFFLSRYNSIFYYSISGYFKHLLPFFEYSEAIYLKIKELYHKFDLNNKGVITEKKINYNFINDFDNIDCEKFDLKKDSESHFTIKCTNGDGIIFGRIDSKEKKLKTKENIDLNLQVVEFLNNLNRLLKQHDISTVLIIEPSFYSYSLKMGISKLSLFEFDKLFDFSQLKIEEFLYGDLGHLNVYGRYYYSQYLYKRLINNEILHD